MCRHYFYLLPASMKEELLICLKTSFLFLSKTDPIREKAEIACVPPSRNTPNVHVERKDTNLEGWHGAELAVTILGNWQGYRAKIIKYLRQIAVITPYAQFRFRYKTEDEKNCLDITFSRRTDRMPAPPKVPFCWR